MSAGRTRPARARSGPGERGVPSPPGETSERSLTPLELSLPQYRVLSVLAEGTTAHRR